ncbi:hypothetical protein HBH56_043710 [Parastagonospora nodorum]|uniref:Uncharacterized protein n=2 Tax=Phaeosphaeria nodorum (strain SN15 / ATCC MYA-4574 / FGSC 10173) TaxID=321614 RepID=A0A7U2EVV4_PHANO|nr:hypothetical protein SNOG_08125 [Parastagonospora nodorum SN15]KAH3917698.1 hypothetical protein HBH56_043710 [Parastagonospora nodorum]EAT84401.1 hypothetical protein SNOG_08125 [Parastagonospora nodorum SN15]KAH3932930.1 hypothetical protein HBH54_071460 [Parastagonospora nodorum]KAH3946255.1 hypothetical protein HBH53_130650 [Parastagonospora nodorum]KAH4038541.1 hypothetical protein HBI09_052650 [Parastagonospora nodorum]
MRFVVFAASLPGAFALWNQELCKGAGACIDIGVLVSYPFRCPDGSAITRPSFGTDLQKAALAGATRITKEEFPKTCYAGKVPSANAIFVRTTTRNGQTAYTFIEEGCTDPNPKFPKDCYHYTTNASTYTFCQLVDAKGGQCTENLQAGRCERWGDTAGRTECKDWKIGQPDFPDDE